MRFSIGFFLLLSFSCVHGQTLTNFSGATAVSFVSPPTSAVLRVDNADYYRLNKNGSFVDVHTGLFMHSYHVPNYFDWDAGKWIHLRRTDPLMNAGVSAGYRFYFGDEDRKFSSGVLAAARLDFGFTTERIAAIKWNVINVGYACVYQLNPLSGLEMNATIGGSVIFDKLNLGDQELTGKGSEGLSIGSHLKYRYRRLAFGVEYNRSFESRQRTSSADVFSLTVGIAF